MYQDLLIIHSYWRWLVLISLFFISLKSFVEHRKNTNYSNTDSLIRKLTVSIVHIQLILGLLLYVVSPFVNLFFKDIGVGLQLREARFFSIEHSLMMLISIALITIGSVKVKRRKTNSRKHKTTYVWFGV